MQGAGTPIWDDLATLDDLASLTPPRPPRVSSRPDVLVVGGGVIGLTVAASCTQAGMDVVLVERRPRLALAASGRAAGGLSPDGHPELTPRWHSLARRSLDLHRAFDSSHDVGLRMLDLLVLPDAVIPDQAHVDPLRFCAALARHAGTILVDQHHTDIDARYVVYACGCAPDDPSNTWVKGHIVATEPAEPVLDAIVVSFPDDVMAVQLPSGEILCGGTKEPGIDSGDVDEDVVARVTAVLHRVCGATPRVTHRWTCFRPLATTELPSIVRTDDRNVCVSGCYSTGILMAPVIGELVATAIANGTDLPVLS